MKLLLFSLIMIFSLGTVVGQVGIGTTTPDQNAILDLTSTTKGFLIPRMTFAQKNAISANVGMLVYQTNASGINLAGVYVFDGSIWKRLARADELGGGGSGTSTWTATSDDQYSNVTGNVGIGTATPLSKFHLYGNMAIDNSSNPIIQFKNAGTDIGFIQLSGNNIRLGTNASNADGKIVFRANGNDHMFIKNNGLVGVGISDPTFRLEVSNTAKFYNGIRIDPVESNLGDNANIDLYANPEHANDIYGSALINFFNWQDAGGGNYTYTRKYKIDFEGGSSERLKISHIDQSNQLVLNKNGEVGIGIAPSGEKLEVRGDVKIYDTYPVLKMQTDDNTSTTAGIIEFYTANNTNSGKIGTQSGSLKLSGRSNASTVLFNDLVLSDNNVGVNNASPITKLHILGGQDAGINSSSNGYIMNGSSTGTNLIIDNNEIMARDGVSPGTLSIQFDGGNVNIGGATEFYQKATINTNGEVLKLNGTDPNIGFYQNGSYKSFIQQNGNELFIGNNSSDIRLGSVDDVIFQATDDVAIEPGGQVVIGTKNNLAPDYKLTVSGKVICEELKVELYANWPDYVFQKDYHLPSLEALEKYISEHSHLPNIPSAEQVSKEGIEVGEMNRRLLEKIEELTLYIIDLEKRISSLERK